MADATKAVATKTPIAINIFADPLFILKDVLAARRDRNESLNNDRGMAETSLHRADLIQEAFRLEYLTLAWMVIEAGVAIGAGVAAHSVTLVAFGIDSLVELASAIVLIWRLTVELRHGQSLAESVERRASRIGGALLFALAAYVVAAAGWSLWTGQGQEFSWPGLLVSLIAIPLMWVLSRRKLRLADALGSQALRADAVESIACVKEGGEAWSAEEDDE